MTTREKGRDRTQSYGKSPYTNRQLKKILYKTKTPPKPSIMQRLQADLGRSVGVATATQLVWLNGLRDPNLVTNRKSCVFKRAYIEKYHQVSQNQQHRTMSDLISPSQLSFSLVFSAIKCIRMQVDFHLYSRLHFNLTCMQNVFLLQRLDIFSFFSIFGVRCTPLTLRSDTRQYLCFLPRFINVDLEG